MAMISDNKKRAGLLKRQADFFFRIAELTYTGFTIGAFVAWAFEKKIGLFKLIVALFIGMVVVWGLFNWGSKLYERSLEEEDQ